MKGQLATLTLQVLDTDCSPTGSFGRDDNHVEEVVEVHRDRHAGEWRQRMTYARGQSIAMAAFPDVEIEVAAMLPPAAKP